MKHMKKIRSLVLLTLILLFQSLETQAQQQYENLVVAGFYPYTKDYVLKPENIPLQHLTHLVYCFAGPRADGSISTETGSYHNPSLVARTHAAGRKFIIMMGGGLQSGGYHAMASTQATRTIFINTLVDWCRTYGYDGVNIDWEYPGDNNKNEDRENLTALIQEMRQAFTTAQSQLGKYLEISIDVHSSLYYATWVDFATIKNYVDWFGLMAYDYAGDWSYSIHAAHNAPLFCGPPEICDRYLSVDTGVKNLTQSLGISPSQIVMGVPFYGREFYNSALYQTPREGGGGIAHYDVKPLIGNGWTRYWDDQSKVPYLLKTSGSGFISYDDEISLTEKTNYIKQNELLGAMAWEITQDVDKVTKQQPLLTTLGTNLVGQPLDTEGKPTVSISSPAQNFVFTPGSNLSISANASVETGFTIQRVEFYGNGNLLGSDQTSPYSVAWQNIPNGKHTLKAKAFSSNGKSTESAVINITDGLLPQVTEMFDDFSYASSSDPELEGINDWIVVDGVSGPPSGAVYSKDLITFTTDPDNANNKIMGVATRADNNPSNTRHSRIETSVMPYRNGTFAARVYFDDTPAIYGDGNVETFYTINSYATCNQADLYSECDFEYLPWDAWHWERQKTMYTTTWETCEIRDHMKLVRSYEGWHDLIYTCAEGQPVKYYIDGQLFHSQDRYQPDSDVNISFANWIYQNITGSNTTIRTTTMKVDWVYHAKNAVLPREDVLAIVASLRQSNILRKNLAGETVVSGPPNPAPTVAITAPANNAVFVAPANINITATAADQNGTITAVAFYNGTTLLSTDTSSPYSFAWNNVPAGNYTIIARATDNGGATGSAQVNVTVSTNPPPAVSITSPSNNASFSAPANITLQASASDTNGTISSVAFYNGTTLLGTDISSPYSFAWNNVSPGSYALTARATDNGGAVTTSAIVNITVTGNTPPTISITSPANNATFAAPASITIQATAADADGTIASVAFYNGTALLGTDTATPYSFNWTNVAVGNYSITARATDNQGAVTSSAAVAISVVNNIPPTASITSPANNATFIAPASITINATASDANGTVSSVAFYNGTTLLGTDTSSPYNFSWTNVAVGSYSLTVRATDNQGAVTTSAPVSVVVNPYVPVQLEVVYRTIVEWGTGFQGEVRVNNLSSVPASNWRVEFNCPHNLTPIWDAVITSHVGNHYVVNGTSTTQNIPANQSIVFGFIGNIANGQSFVAPSGFTVSLPGGGARADLPGYTTGVSEIITYCYPNPFTHTTTIEFILPEESHTDLSVYDSQGRNISTLVHEVLAAGKHTRQWRPDGNTSGLFFYQLKTARGVLTQKIIKR
jgi:GH18 family chitinase